MQRWEYRVVSFADGRYTAPLNEYGADGWELVTVVHDLPPAPPAEGGGRGLPMPGVVGRAQAAASAIERFGGSDDDVPGGPTLLWVLRRALPADE